MPILAAVVRPVNMFRGTQVRASSVYTSNWGLARLSNRADSPAMKQTVYKNLFSRIDNGTVALDSLYRFDKVILGEALKRSNETALTRLVKTVRPSKFELSYKGKGIEITDVIDGAGKTTKAKQPYEADAVRNVRGYNLPFFIWMRGVIGQSRWEGIVRTIFNSDRLLGRSLENLDGRLSAEREALRKQYPLPQKRSIRLQ